MQHVIFKKHFPRWYKLSELEIVWKHDVRRTEFFKFAGVLIAQGVSILAYLITVLEVRIGTKMYSSLPITHGV